MKRANLKAIFMYPKFRTEQNYAYSLLNLDSVRGEEKSVV
jgi:hypothetical protein